MFAVPSGGDVNFMFKFRGHLFKSTQVQNKREEEGVGGGVGSGFSQIGVQVSCGQSFIKGVIVFFHMLPYILFI